MDKYKALISLEMHCEFSETNSKVFSSAKNDFSDIPNASVNAIDMAFPGTLPVLNKKAVEMALKLSMILNCKQPEYMYFERKNYYYPDLPKGYQITQETKPAPVGIYGSLDFEHKGEIKTVRINNIHLEEDTASQDHYSNYSTLNYNRAGVPLLELVTEPDLHSADEAVAFLETMKSIYQYAGISEANAQKGQIRCDVNVSIMDEDLDETDPKNWGTRVEVKNVNSFSAARDTINYEIERQIQLKQNGKYDEMEQQTRRWDEESGTTIYMRNKSDAIDYRFFVEPNIPKYKISKEWLEKIRQEIPKFALERKKQYIEEYGLTNVEASTIVKEKAISDYYEETVKMGANPKTVANWLTTTILGYINKEFIDIKDFNLTPDMLYELIELVENKEISSKQGKDVFNYCIGENKRPKEIVKEKNMVQVQDDSIIRNAVIEVINSHPEEVEKYKTGRGNLLGFFVGQVMKVTKGQANPAMTSNIVKEELEKR